MWNHSGPFFRHRFRCSSVHGDVAFPRLCCSQDSTLNSDQVPEGTIQTHFLHSFCLFLFFCSSVLFGQAEWLITVIRRELDLGDLGSVRGILGASRGCQGRWGLPWRSGKLEKSVTHQECSLAEEEGGGQPFPPVQLCVSVRQAYQTRLCVSVYS